MNVFFFKENLRLGGKKLSCQIIIMFSRNTCSVGEHFPKENCCSVKKKKNVFLFKRLFVQYKVHCLSHRWFFSFFFSFFLSFTHIFLRNLWGVLNSFLSFFFSFSFCYLNSHILRSELTCHFKLLVEQRECRFYFISLFLSFVED